MSKNLLSQLAKGIVNKKPTKQDRPTVDVPTGIYESFERLVGAKALYEVAEARLDVESDLVKSEMLEVFAESIYHNGCVPANPKLQTELVDGRPDCSGIFQVQNRFKYTIPDEVNGETDIAARLLYTLESIGMETDKAQALIDNEIDCSPVVSLRPFGELVDGHYEGEGKNRTFVEASAEEKAVGQKLLEFVTGTSTKPLSEEDRAIAVRIEERIKPKEGFLQRLKGYCSSLDILKGIFKVITPTHFVSHMKLGISDTPEHRQTRLKFIAADIIGTDRGDAVKIKKAA